MRGAGEIGALFTEVSLLTPLPWEQAGQRTTHATYDHDLVAALLSGVPLTATFADLDPVDLRGTQSFVTRAGVAYYLDDGYRRHGRTYADQMKAGNKYPVVYRRDGQNLVLSGHHRAAAALLHGRPFPARVIDGPWGPERGSEAGVVSLERRSVVAPPRSTDSVFVTPSVIACAQQAPHLPHLMVRDTPDAFAVIIQAGCTAWMPYDATHERIQDVLTLLSPTPEWAGHQLHYAATGRLLPVG